MSTSNARTLDQRLSEGRISVPEALRYALSLAECLRKIHDSGHAHGAVTPSHVAITATGLDPIAAPGTEGTAPIGVTPYTAPELLQGKPPDARSDIFAFGAIVFEIFTGRRAFDGDGPEALTLSLANSAPPPSGSPLVDRLVANCVAKDPAARWQRMQKIIMELKLLAVAARRAETPAPSRAKVEADLRVEMQHLEERVAARLEAHEKSMARMQQAASEAVNALRGQLASMNTQLAAAQEQMAQPSREVQSMGERIVSRVEETIDSASQRIAAVEHSLEELCRNSAILQENVSADLAEFGQALKAQAGAIESARTAIAQTDDLVERVVEALEILQTSVLDRQEDRAAPAN